MKGLSGQSGSDEDGLNLFKEEKEQIHNLFNKASLLKMDVCHAIEHGVGTSTHSTYNNTM